MQWIHPRKPRLDELFDIGSTNGSTKIIAINLHDDKATQDEK